jgi:Cu(I)/Ag(I) efflux system membrane fusion protein
MDTAPRPWKTARNPASLRRRTSDGGYLRSLQARRFAAADAAAALAADDLDGYLRQRGAVRAALAGWFAASAHAMHSPLADYRDGLPDPKDLAAAGGDFEPFSTAVADLAIQAGLHETGNLHVFECPMSPVLGKARWLQRDSRVRNPFFGSSMPGCGEEITHPDPARRAPTGMP